MSIGSGTGKAAGTSTITGSYSGHTGTLSITVIDGSAITASPASLSLVAGGTPIPFTVTCTKADGTTDGSPTYTATSSDTGVATVAKSGTTVTVTGVAAGTCTINLSYTSTTSTVTGAVGISASAGGGSVTSVTVSPASSLIFASDTPVLTAKDQGGSVLDGTVGAWSSSDATNAPINSSTGAITPSASKMVGVTFTYTHTASGFAGTAAATVLPSYTPIKDDKPWANYTSQTDLRAAMRNNINDTSNAVYGTGVGQGCRYTDGLAGNLVTLDTSPEGSLGGRQTLLLTLPAGDAAVGANGNPILRASFDAAYAPRHRAWVVQLERYAPAGEVKTGTANGTVTASGFTPLTGTGVGGAAAYKRGPNVGWTNYTGRWGLAWTNSGGTPATTDVVNTMDTNNSDLTTSPGSEVIIGKAASDEWSGRWYWNIGLVEPKSGNILSSRWWRFPLGSTPAPFGSPARFEGYMLEGFALPLPFSGSLNENFNQTRQAGQTMFRNIGYWCYIDGDAYLDPLGLLGTQPTQTLTSITVSSLAHGVSNQTIVFTGTGFNENCNPIFSNSGVRVLTLSYDSSTQITATVSVTSTATTGAGTVLMHNNASGSDSSTVPFTVT